MRKAALFFGLIMLGGMAVSGSARAEMYDAEYRSCSEATTVGIVDCLSGKTRMWDTRLNSAFKAAMARIEPQQRDALRQAQRNWIQYRDSNCRAYGARSGSVSAIETAECLRAMTAYRSLELAKFGQN